MQALQSYCFLSGLFQKMHQCLKEFNVIMTFSLHAYFNALVYNACLMVFSVFFYACLYCHNFGIYFSCNLLLQFFIFEFVVSFIALHHAQLLFNQMVFIILCSL